MPTLTGAVVLVTGSNGGIGSAFVREALARGAEKVYATARTPREWDDDLAETVFDTVEAGGMEVIADEFTATVKAGLSGPISVLYPELSPGAS